MKIQTKWTIAILLSLGGLGGLTAGAVQADPPAAPKVSTFAPADDLLQQVEYFTGRIEDSLASEADYTSAKQSRVVKDANTLAVLGLALALHDQQNRLSEAGPALIETSQTLAKSAEDYAKAKEAFANVQKALAGEIKTEQKPTEWTRVASLGQLMKQVPLINSTLKRGLDERRFERQAVESAGLAASLATIAQAALVDTHEVKNPADTEKWYQYSADMRDAAGQINVAIHGKDLAAAKAAAAKMMQACDACHETFRVE